MTFCDWSKVKAEEVSWKYQRKAVEAGPLAVAMLDVLQGATTHPHAHAHEEVILVLKGAWKFVLRGEGINLRGAPASLVPQTVPSASVIGINVTPWIWSKSGGKGRPLIMSQTRARTR